MHGGGCWVYDCDWVLANMVLKCDWEKKVSCVGHRHIFLTIYQQDRYFITFWWHVTTVPSNWMEQPATAIQKELSHPLWQSTIAACSGFPPLPSPCPINPSGLSPATFSTNSLWSLTSNSMDASVAIPARDDATVDAFATHLVSVYYLLKFYHI